jgi:hypothetical protein
MPVPRLAEKIARIFALLGLIAALLAPAFPGFAAAAPARPAALHAAMGCGNEAADTHRQVPTHPVPAHHAPGAMDCCVANVCAMNLALPASPATFALSVQFTTAAYALRALQPPPGVDTAPIPHPPKAA